MDGGNLENSFLNHGSLLSTTRHLRGVCPLPFLHELLHRLPRARVWQRSAVPLLQMLFRPEEVVLPSGPTPVDHRFRRLHPDEPTVAHLNMDSIDAVGARVVQADAVLFILAADQQQKVYRSRHPKPLPRVQAHRVVHEAETPEELLVAFS